MTRPLLLFASFYLSGFYLAGPTVAQVQGELYTSEMVLFVDPDSMQLHRLAEEMGEDFFVVADDENWYRAEAYSLLDSLQIEYRFVDRGPISFLVGGDVKEYDWQSVEAAWFVVLYDGKREPKVLASIDLPFEIGYLRP